MSSTDRLDALRAILDKYGQPDPALVSKLPKGGNKDRGSWRDCRTCGGWHAPNAVHLDYVGHAEITRALIEIDPEWNWQPVEWHEGAPRVHERNGVATMWGWLTVLDKSVLGVGTCDASKPDRDKELVGDFLRNAAMRLGVALALWSKAEWDSAPAHSPAAASVDTVTGEVIDDPFEWAHNAMLEATSLHALDAVANLAKHKLNDEQRAELRPLYLERKAELTAGGEP